MPRSPAQLRSDTGSRCGPVVSLTEAARQLEVHPSTLRRWTSDEDCPCESAGEPGRGKGAKYIVENVRRWRARKHGVELRSELDLELLAEGLLAAHRRGNRGETRPLHEELGIPSARAAVLYAEAYVSIVRTLTGREPIGYPPAIETLHACAVLLRSGHQGSE